VAGAKPGADLNLGCDKGGCDQGIRNIRSQIDLEAIQVEQSAQREGQQEVESEKRAGADVHTESDGQGLPQRRVPFGAVS
jgi:hypothetical protein